MAHKFFLQLPQAANFRVTPLATIAAIMLALPMWSHAVTYTWVDDRGVVNYSERLPRDVPRDRVQTVGDRALGPSSSPTQPATYSPASRPAAGNSAQPDSDDNLTEEQQRMLAELQAAEAARQAQVAEIRQDNCERSRRVLQNLSAKSRIRVNNSDGTARVLPEEERQERISAAQKGVATNCDG